MLFTIKQFENYLISQDSLGDIMYNLSEENILKANELELSEHDLECQMSIEDFIESVKIGCITSNDGFGYYGFEEGKYDIEVDFSENIIRSYIAEFEFTHVYWYNK